MMDQDGATLRSVAWREVCPWLALFRVFRIAADVRVLLPAAAGVLLMFGGWALLGHAFQPAGWMADNGPGVFDAINASVPDRPGVLVGISGRGLVPHSLDSGNNPFVGSWSQLTRPLVEVFRPEASPQSVSFAALCGLWALAVWSLFGAMITRVAVVQIAAEERVGLMQAFRFAASKWLSYFLAPVLPLVGILLCALGVFFPALLANFDAGLILVGLAWPIALACGFVMALLLTGLLFGWPMMASTISAEGSDTFDALSRSYAYVFQRPMHYLFYASVAAVFGAICWVLVSNFTSGIIAMTHWAASWAVGWDRMGVLSGSGGSELGEIGRMGVALVSLWVGCLKLIAVGFVYGYFFAASGCIYLLLRRDVDATEMDEVYQDADATEPSYGLPPVPSAESGAPVVTSDSGEDASQAE
ncbi:MAG: hypothetical protein U1E05_14925 [Patescibacteria group bacterium]|nr:hypothetical protein [Patescibacteria group bacterium]